MAETCAELQNTLHTHTRFMEMKFKKAAAKLNQIYTYSNGISSISFAFFLLKKIALHVVIFVYISLEKI